MNKFIPLTLVIGILFIVMFCSIWGVVTKKEYIIVTAPTTVTTLSKPVVASDWVVEFSVPIGDTCNVVKVGYTQKYGTYVELYCKAVFNNSKTGQYKFVAPWLDGALVERSNMDDITYKLVPIDSSNKQFLMR